MPCLRRDASCSTPCWARSRSARSRWGFVPDPVAVEATTVQRGPLQVTVDEDGETRARDRYVVSAPVAGRVSRIELHEGDAVRARPGRRSDSGRFRYRRASARSSSRASQRLKRWCARRRNASGTPQTDYEQAKRERLRIDAAWCARASCRRRVREQAQVTGNHQRQRAAGGALPRALRLRRTHRRPERRCWRCDGERGAAPAAIPVRSPVEGKVLRIPDKSERVVTPGAPLLVVGDPSQLEVVIDLLSTEAVKVKPGMPVLLEGWGGDRPLQARVRVVEPLAFTKVSALGVEEQRVNVIADFVDPPGPLGDAYRVEARVVLWSGDDVLKVPVSALFRRGENWNVFVIDGARARRREVEIGHRGALEVEIAKGLSAGEQVVRHPSNDVADGRRVRMAR